ncbi:uncharacterized protein LOC130206652 [Pseudoliparis swirei]|uniref:uncharacterized protein LOC130206652 n=1 Tax=Pseudoliparis swirei TaxID=2059687 RepID=UPI0024BDA396|nr:uncharacterized protein LOC130206652 [Pseudoliparis swirei]
MEGVTQVHGASVLEQHHLSRVVAPIHRENEEAPSRSMRSVAPATGSSALDASEAEGPWSAERKNDAAAMSPVWSRVMLVPSKGPVLTIVPKSQDSVKVQVHVSKPWRSGGVVQTAHRRIRDHPATPDDVEPDVELHHHLSCHGSGHRHCGGKPLLCISLLALLLLPLSLSCYSKRPHQEVRDDYRVIVQIDISNANRNIAALLHNSSCPVLKQKQHNCISNNMVVVSTLHLLTCKMKSLNISQTDGLTTSVLNSIRCPCLRKPTKEPNVKSKRRRATKQRRNKQKIRRRETKKLCRAEAILSSMTNCYQMLNTILIDN